MGRDGGIDDAVVFSTLAEMEAYLDKAEKENKEFSYFKIIRDPRVFRNQAEAERVLEDLAEDKDPGDDSKVLVSGSFYLQDEKVAAEIKKETEAFYDVCKKLVKAPAGSYNECDRKGFARCSKCNSEINLEVSNKKRDRSHGTCPVCQDNSIEPFGRLLEPDEYHEITGRRTAGFGYSDSYSANGSDLMRKRTLYRPDYDQIVRSQHAEFIDHVDKFKKRKTNLENQAKTQEKRWIVVGVWTSAHY
jgi:hypothetical protein